MPRAGGRLDNRRAVPIRATPVEVTPDERAIGMGRRAAPTPVAGLIHLPLTIRRIEVARPVIPAPAPAPATAGTAAAADPPVPAPAAPAPAAAPVPTRWRIVQVDQADPGDLPVINAEACFVRFQNPHDARAPAPRPPGAAPTPATPVPSPATAAPAPTAAPTPRTSVQSRVEDESFTASEEGAGNTVGQYGNTMGTNLRLWFHGNIRSALIYAGVIDPDVEGEAKWDSQIDLNHPDTAVTILLPANLTEVAPPPSTNSSRAMATAVRSTGPVERAFVLVGDLIKCLMEPAPGLARGYMLCTTTLGRSIIIDWRDKLGMRKKLLNNWPVGPDWVIAPLTERSVHGWQRPVKGPGEPSPNPAWGDVADVELSGPEAEAIARSRPKRPSGPAGGAGQDKRVKDTNDGGRQDKKEKDEPSRGSSGPRPS